MKTKKRIKALESQLNGIVFVLNRMMQLEMRRFVRDLATAPKPAEPAKPEAPHEAT
jgi:hypothetical protein